MSFFLFFLFFEMWFWLLERPLALEGSRWRLLVARGALPAVTPLGTKPASGRCPVPQILLTYSLEWCQGHPLVQVTWILCSRTQEHNLHTTAQMTQDNRGFLPKEMRSRSDKPSWQNTFGSMESLNLNLKTWGKGTVTIGCSWWTLPCCEWGTVSLVTSSREGEHPHPQSQQFLEHGAELSTPPWQISVPSSSPGRWQWLLAGCF